MRRFTLAVFTAGGVAAAAAGVYAAGHAAKDVALEFPADYKSSFVNYYNGDRQNGKQFISLYASPLAIQSAQANGEVPYGSVLIGELYPVVTDADGEPVESSLGRLISKGEPSAIVMMQRIKGNDERYEADLKVGDWEFEVFSPSGENLGKDTTACRECHHPHSETEFLYSREHLTLKPES